jgi:ATP-dependent protease HslVU (ClpYQ) peptidase subunit
LAAALLAGAALIRFLHADMLAELVALLALLLAGRLLAGLAAALLPALAALILLVRHVRFLRLLVDAVGATPNAMNCSRLRKASINQTAFTILADAHPPRRDMTCIVGLIDNGDVYLGGDAAGVAGLDVTVRADRKVVRNGEFLFGFTTSFRMGQLLGFRLQPPVRQPDADIFQFMVVDFIDAVRACLKDGGYAQRVNDIESGGNFLVAYQGRLFQIGSDYQVGEVPHGFDAVGCGANFALGSLASTEGMEPHARVLKALEVAEEFSGGVRGPFHIERLSGAAVVPHPNWDALRTELQGISAA